MEIKYLSLLVLVGLSPLNGAAVEAVGPDGAAMVLVRQGEFLMGSLPGEGEVDEYPQHKVNLDAYLIDKYPVTNEQYAKFLNAYAYGKDVDENGETMIYEHPRGVKKADVRWTAARGYEKHPVIFVTWYGANQYAKHFNKRLPTEAEWEKAAKAGGGDGEAQLKGHAWYVKNSGGKTHPVGTKKSNTRGLHDMQGNVGQWCGDWYDPGYYGKSPAANPTGPERAPEIQGQKDAQVSLPYRADTGHSRSIRGCGWQGDVNGCRAGHRMWGDPEFRADYIGFRCVAQPAERP